MMCYLLLTYSLFLFTCCSVGHCEPSVELCGSSVDLCYILCGLVDPVVDLMDSSLISLDPLCTSVDSMWICVNPLWILCGTLRSPAKMFCENLSDVMEPVSLRFHRLMCMLCWLRFYKTGFPPSSAAFVMHSKNKKWERERKGREPVNDYGAPLQEDESRVPGARRTAIQPKT